MGMVFLFCTVVSALLRAERLVEKSKDINEGAEMKTTTITCQDYSEVAEDEGVTTVTMLLTDITTQQQNHHRVIPELIIQAKGEGDDFTYGVTITIQKNFKTHIVICNNKNTVNDEVTCVTSNENILIANLRDQHNEKVVITFSNELTEKINKFLN